VSGIRSRASRKKVFPGSPAPSRCETVAIRAQRTGTIAALASLEGKVVEAPGESGLEGAGCAWAS
jgi:hypothetical protein